MDATTATTLPYLWLWVIPLIALTIVLFVLCCLCLCCRTPYGLRRKHREIRSSEPQPENKGFHRMPTMHMISRELIRDFSNVNGTDASGLTSSRSNTGSDIQLNMSSPTAGNSINKTEKKYAEVNRTPGSSRMGASASPTEYVFGTQSVKR